MTDLISWWTDHVLLELEASMKNAVTMSQKAGFIHGECPICQ